MRRTVAGSGTLACAGNGANPVRFPEELVPLRRLMIPNREKVVESVFAIRTQLVPPGITGEVKSKSIAGPVSRSALFATKPPCRRPGHTRAGAPLDVWNTS